MCHPAVTDRSYPACNFVLSTRSLHHCEMQSMHMCRKSWDGDVAIPTDSKSPITIALEVLGQGLPMILWLWFQINWFRKCLLYNSDSSDGAINKKMTNAECHVVIAYLALYRRAEFSVVHSLGIKFQLLFRALVMLYVTSSWQRASMSRKVLLFFE